MKKKHIITLFVLLVVISIEGKKISRGRSSSSGRGSSRKTNYNPQPTSISQAQPASAPKQSLFGWQEKPVQRTQTQSKPSNSHSYPSSQTGLSGNSPPKQPSNHQESIQRSNAPQNLAGQQTHTNNQPGHSYPTSHGLSGNSGPGGGYPQQSSGLSGSGSAHSQQGSGLSGSGAGYPQQGSGLSGSGAAAHPPQSIGGSHHQPPPPYSNSNAYPKQQQAPPPYSAGNYPSNNYGNNNHHQQGPPPPYSNNYGGYGGHQGSYNPGPQMPGYFGGYGNRGFGGVSRSRSALTGVGIAGAGVGTLLTGLALWNLARSTGRQHHTVIYDNRGQPVAVAPNNSTEPVVDPILGDLVNCTLTISSDNATEVLAIPCSIATSFTPEADVKDAGTNNTANDNTKCTVTVNNKAGREFMTTIPCSILLNSAAENNVTEPPLLNNGTDDVNGTIISAAKDAGDISNTNQPSALTLSHGVDNTNLNCTHEPGVVRDPINPCFAVSQNLTVIPLDPEDTSASALLTTPGSA